MKILSLIINNVRGIRELELVPAGNNLIVWGPNGSGKSGVIDAIEFLFSGRISRLVGEGTRGITLLNHGRHIDVDRNLVNVEAEVEVDGISNTVTVSRSMEHPGEFNCPDSARPYLAEAIRMASRGQMCLTRRAILEFIVAESGTRADRLQTLMNIGNLERLRRVLGTANQQAIANYRVAVGVRDSHTDVLMRLLPEDEIEEEEDALLVFINRQRTELGASHLENLDGGSARSQVPPPAGHERQSVFSTVVFRAATETLLALVNAEQRARRLEARTALAAHFASLEQDPGLAAARDSYVVLRGGLSLIHEDTTVCPLCDSVWGPGELLAHVRNKHDQAVEGRRVEGLISAATATLSEDTVKAKESLLAALAEIAKAEETAFANSDRILLSEWLARLIDDETSLQDRARIIELCSEATAGVDTVSSPPDTLELLERVKSASVVVGDSIDPKLSAWDTLGRIENAQIEIVNAGTVVQEKLRVQQRATYLLGSYLSNRDSVLEALWSDIAVRFSELYCYLHPEETDTFAAAIDHEDAGIIIGVDFFGRGSHPPQALHSEGHQDSMGLCLFLALQEQLDPAGSALCVLDDVVMSVDSGHRRLICGMIREKYPDKQFIITTHDRNWMQQMKQRQVASPDNIVRFTSWSPEAGPVVHLETDHWGQIYRQIEDENIESAASTLREDLRISSRPSVIRWLRQFGTRRQVYGNSMIGCRRPSHNSRKLTRRRNASRSRIGIKNLSKHWLRWSNGAKIWWVTYSKINGRSTLMYISTTGRN